MRTAPNSAPDTKENLSSTPDKKSAMRVLAAVKAGTMAIALAAQALMSAGCSKCSDTPEDEESISADATPNIIDRKLSGSAGGCFGVDASSCFGVDAGN